MISDAVLNLVGAAWVLLLGIALLMVYFTYERNRVSHAIGDFLIEFSFIKRTKSIILSYSLLALFIGIIGLLISLVTR